MANLLEIPTTVACTQAYRHVAQRARPLGTPRSSPFPNLTPTTAKLLCPLRARIPQLTRTVSVTARPSRAGFRVFCVDAGSMQRGKGDDMAFDMDDELLSQPLPRKTRRVAPVFTVEQAMTTTMKDMPTFSPETPIAEVIEEFLRRENVSAFPVVDDDENLVGLISLTDIMWHEAMEDIIETERAVLSADALEKANRYKSRASDANFMQGTVIDSMSKKPIVAKPSMLVSEAAAKMLTHQVTRLPVVADKGPNKGKVVGMLTRQDIMRCIAAAWT